MSDRTNANHADRKSAAKSGPGEVPPLRARDAEPVAETGIDVGISEAVPATAKDAHVGQQRIVQRDRFRPTIWYATLIGAFALLAIVLGYLTLA